MKKSITSREDTVLLIIDVQDRLISTISGADRILINIEALIKTAKIYTIPILLTEQEKLGETVPQLREILKRSGSYDPIRKLSFSCYGNEKFRRILEETDRSNLLICGIEAHICVSQTALDLMENGYKIQVVEDATSSHTKEDFRIVINRLRDSGATITSTEALIYELAANAETPEFKRILEFVKDRRRRIESIL